MELIPPLTSVQEAALNAAGEAMVDLGFYASLTISPDFHEGNKPWFNFCARAELEDFIAKGGATPAEAAANWVIAANEVIANPPPKRIKSATAAKEAALAAVAEGGSPEEIAERIKALPV